MTRKEVKTFLNHIHKYYPKDFIVDEYKVDTWSKTLQYYNSSDVNAKFEQHLKNEKFKEQVPTLNFLTMYLTPIKAMLGNSAYVCRKCHKVFNSKEAYNTHYSRCVKISTMIRDMNKYYSTNLTREQFEKYSDEEIEQIYYRYIEKMLNLETGIEPARKKILLDCLPQDLKKKYEGKRGEYGREQREQTEKLESERNSQSSSTSGDIQQT